MSASTYGIKETLEFASFLNATVKAGIAAKKAGVKLTLLGIFASVPLFLPAIGLSQAAFADISLIPKEFGDLQADEAAQVIAIVNDGLELENKLTEHKIERLFATTLNTYVEYLDIFKN